MTAPEIYVVTAELRRSGDHAELVGRDASSSRAALAGAMSGTSGAWKSAGRGGFEKFIDILEQQTNRLRTDLTELGDKLRAAADDYDRQDLECAVVLADSVSVIATGR
ncbi:type VII secretion target [Mycobacterium sp. URHB0044]|uniref:type VII secretion target n=1 Tax=Mycobacterium sp. URHB0044 TaxID=1380386 RepID=UPI00055B401C|nr:type VII secretion target [Mycobacterium sp. URHB0044]